MVPFAQVLRFFGLGALETFMILKSRVMSPSLLLHACVFLVHT